MDTIQNTSDSLKEAIQDESAKFVVTRDKQTPNGQDKPERPPEHDASVRKAPHISGMSRNCLIIITVVTLVNAILLGAVLGGVLGSGLNKPSRTRNNTSRSNTTTANGPAFSVSNGNLLGSSICDDSIDGKVYTSNASLFPRNRQTSFTQLCNVNWPNGTAGDAAVNQTIVNDIAIVLAASLADCIDYCVLYNNVGGPCRAVNYDFNASRPFKFGGKGNCWLKDSRGRTDNFQTGRQAAYRMRRE